MSAVVNAGGVKVKVLLVLLGVLGSAGCSSQVATEASVGDCFQSPESSTEVAELDKVDCDEPHDNEVFATFDLDDGDFPGTADVERLAQEGCIQRFERYVGALPETTDLGLFSITPNRRTWGTGDREVICAAFALDGDVLEGSIEGAGR
ncbi:MAG: septum formation family protein [Acidimicrobiales bacterium]